MTFSFRVSDLYLIKKEKLAVNLLFLGMAIAFLGSMNPWFMWSLGSYYPVPAALCLAGAYLVSHTMEKPIFNRTDYLLPISTFLLFALYERFSMESNINAFLMLGFRFVIFFSLFTLDLERLGKLITFICKLLAILLIPSIAGHILYILGFPLPYTNASFGEFYSFSNYYFFLVSDSDIFMLFPRLCSYFLEPSHIGVPCAFLLFAQRGKWRKWYNVVLLVTLFLTFSLAAYIYLVIIMFLNSWVAGKQVVKKLLIVISFLAIGTIATFTYNNGDNLVHDLIMLRMEIDDGEMAGDNRVTGNFEADFDNYVQSSDIIFGRKFEITEFGNSGYRVFFYEHGIVGIALLFLFYFTSMMYTPNKRAFVAVLFMAALYFWVSAFLLWENIYLSFYAAAYLENVASSQESPATSQNAINARHESFENNSQ